MRDKENSYVSADILPVPTTRVEISWKFYKTCKVTVHLVLFYYRSQGPVECEHLKNNVTLDCEKIEEKMMHRYVSLSN